MPVSSEAESWPPEVTTACRELVGWSPVRVERIGGGRNSRVYRVGREDSQGAPTTFVLKQYLRHPGDRRDRLATEFGAYRFLWDHDVRVVPEPVAMSPELSVGNYEHIVGDPVRSDIVGEADVDASVAFLSELRRVAGSPESARLGLASEAGFSVQELLDSLERRLARLAPAPDARVQAFIADAYVPAHSEVVQWCGERLDAVGLAVTQVLAPADRTLSPSDFGFHNAIRRPAGELAFVDFEYFGWDDPAKTLADWLLHPGMDVRTELRERFAAEFLRSFDPSGDLARRASIVYPLFGLKWCLILLNEFVPDDLARRRFASPREEYVGPSFSSANPAYVGPQYVGPGFSPADLGTDPGAVVGGRLQPSLDRQLEKAKVMLARTLREYQDNPYVT